MTDATITAWQCPCCEQWDLPYRQTHVEFVDTGWSDYGSSDVTKCWCENCGAVFYELHFGFSVWIRIVETNWPPQVSMPSFRRMFEEKEPGS